MSTPTAILDLAFARVSNNLTQCFIQNNQISQNVEFVCRNPQNRAGATVNVSQRRLLRQCVAYFPPVVAQ